MIQQQGTEAMMVLALICIIVAFVTGILFFLKRRDSWAVQILLKLIMLLALVAGVLGVLAVIIWGAGCQQSLSSIGNGVNPKLAGYLFWFEV